MLPDYPSLILFMTATITLNLIPGTDVMYVASQRIINKKQGILATLGISTGAAIYVLGTAFGLAGIIQHSPIAFELINYKIKVNAILLGLFPSQVVGEFLEKDPKAQAYLNRIPAKRAGQFNGLEGPLLLLASEASNYMYGSIINVDGGFSADVCMDLDIQNTY